MLSADGHTAREISEALLEITGKALIGNDFESFERCFHVPHLIETPDEKRVLKTQAALRRVFDCVVEDYRNRNITDLIRITEVAEFRGPFRVEATHCTHMMSRHLRVMDPFPCFSVLEFIDDRWQCTSSQYAVDQKTTVGRALSHRPNAPHTDPRADTQGAADKRKN